MEVFLDPSSASANILIFPVGSEKQGQSTSKTPESLSGASGDEYLLTCVKNGDREALAFLFRRYAASIRHLGRRLLRDDCEAEDLVQEVFLYVHRKSTLFDPSKGPARSWLFQVAYTQALIHRRRLKSSGYYIAGIGYETTKAKPEVEADANYDRTGEGLFGRKSWEQGVRSLNDEQRQTLRLHFVEGFTFTEIAEKLGQSYANVRNHHYRALEKLRKHLIGGELKGR
jgi:RNA polymerase sigma-70 factor, ECF subfamily